jgi:hypothetical protein
MVKPPYDILEAKILQLVPLPAVMCDPQQNLTVALALCEFKIRWHDEQEAWVVRDIRPVGADYAVNGPPGAYEKLNGLGEYAHEDYENVVPPEVLHSYFDEMIEEKRNEERRWAAEARERARQAAEGQEAG